ncbi:E1A-binding protein p400 isoform X2 [Sagmatias obliquidens]|uniref:E1A-binding protein p400 isoform X2 n=1 Tax=Sagmatias obliquidens TaxID=3371155 RepID=UPI000F43FE2A|nr:E1A-binding protein p400 isoform X2 [Lagenorhynchus obliquidens]
MHHGSGPQNVQHQLQRSRAFAGSEGEEQQARPNPPQSPATPFAPAASPSAPQSPGYQVQQLMNRSPVAGQSVNIALQNVGPVVGGNPQITLAPLPLPSPTSPGFQFSAQQRRFEHGSPSYIQVTSPLSQQVQTQSPTQPSPGPGPGLQSMRAGAPGPGLGLCSSSPTGGFVDASVLVRQISLSPSSGGHFVFQEGSGLAQMAPGAQVQLQHTGAPITVRERRLSQPHAQSGGTVHHLGPQSPAAAGGAGLQPLASPGHITTTSLPPQISSIIQGQLIQQQQVLQGPPLTRPLLPGVGGTSAFGMTSPPPPTSPSRTAAPPGLSSLPVPSAGSTGIRKAPRKLEEIPAASQELAQMRKQCLDYHFREMEALKAAFKEYLVELFFLQHLQGNMMDFLAFKKKHYAPLQAYLRQNDLDLEEEDEDEDEEKSEVINDEVKVVTGKDGQTGTPVAIATQLPPNVSAAFSSQQQPFQQQALAGTLVAGAGSVIETDPFKRQQAGPPAEQSKRPRLEVGHQGVVFQHPGVNTGVPLQQLMPTVQGGMPPAPQAAQLAGQKQSQQRYDPSTGPPVQNAASLHTPPPQLPARLPPAGLPAAPLPPALQFPPQPQTAEPQTPLPVPVKTQPPNAPAPAPPPGQLPAALHVPVPAKAQMQAPPLPSQPQTAAPPRPPMDPAQPCPRPLPSASSASTVVPASGSGPGPSPARASPVNRPSPAAKSLSPVIARSPGAAVSAPPKPQSPAQNAAAPHDGSQDKLAEQIALENQIHQRIADLRKEGLWSLRRLPKLQEAPRSKSHWDYLLEEMQWMATDFAQERRWKVAAAKKLVRTVVRHHEEKQLREERGRREEQNRLRRIAASTAREIEYFWSNIEQVVEIKLQVELEEKRKKALNFQKVSRKGKESRPTGLDALRESFVDSGIPGRKRKASTSLTDDEVEDEEETIAEEEALEGAADHQAELLELAREAELPLIDLMKLYEGAFLPNFQWPQPKPDSEETSEDEDMEDCSGDRESRKGVVLIDSLFIMDQFKATERVVVGKPHTKDIAEVTAVAEAILPKGSARISTAVKLNAPALLYGALRDYQKIGLDWLAKLYRKNLNGVLADEAGLGKTVQIIAFFAHLACNEGNWGPHLVVVRGCNILKWELELKRWCPGLKTLLYVGSHRELKAKRQGWTEPNRINVCITSYKQFFKGYASFTRVRWKCLVIDEMQRVKGMTERHWEAVFTLQSQQRLLLIDAPLHNTFLELWTMVHFLIPGISRPYLHLPLKAPSEENQDYYHKVVIRLHRVTQPFILRRTKRDVEKQLTKKYEHVLKCRLSNRQKALYEDVILQPGTQEALKSGRFVDVLSILLRLQRICNHPGLVAPRLPESSYTAGPLQCCSASLILKALDRDFWKETDLSIFDLIGLENKMTRHESELLGKKKVTRKLFEELFTAPPPSGRPAAVRLKPSRLFQPVQYGQKPEGRTVAFPSTHPPRTATPTATATPQGHVRGRPPIATFSANPDAKAPATPFQTSQASTGAPRHQPASTFSTAPSPAHPVKLRAQTTAPASTPGPPQPQPQAPSHPAGQSALPQGLVLTSQAQARLPSGEVVKIAQLASLAGPPSRVAQPESPVTLQFQGNKFTLSHSQLRQLTAGQPLQLQGSVLQIVSAPGQSYLRPPGPVVMQTVSQAGALNALGSKPPAGGPSPAPMTPPVGVPSRLAVSPLAAGEPGVASKPASPVAGPTQEEKTRLLKERLDQIYFVNERRCSRTPVYGRDLLGVCSLPGRGQLPWLGAPDGGHGKGAGPTSRYTSPSTTHRDLILTLTQRQESLQDVMDRVVCVIPPVVAAPPCLWVARPPSRYSHKMRLFRHYLREHTAPFAQQLQRVTALRSLRFPELRLVQFDSGKLEALAILLQKLKSEGRRVLILSQMVLMLDILEMFLNFHYLTYIRIDENANSEQRQDLMRSFNRDRRVFCALLSTHSRATGVSLVEADAVVFYDHDLNPVMDAKAQEWCDRIGRRKDVHIYRLVSGNSIEEKLLKNGTKDLIREVAAQGNDYSMAFLTQRTIQELFEVYPPVDDTGFPVKAEEFVVLSQEPSVTETIAPKIARPFIEALKSIECLEEDAHESAEELAPGSRCPDGSRWGEEPSPLEELADFMGQLTPIEKYALNYLELFHTSTDQEKERNSEGAVLAAVGEWEARHARALREREARARREPEQQLLTYTREDACRAEFVYEGADGQTEVMPLWTPPTPPQDDNDIYIDSVMCLMYETTPIPESKLPPVYVRKERRRHKTDPSAAGRKKKQRHGEAVVPPRSLFDRATPGMLKIRREGKEQKKNILLKQQTQFAKPLPTFAKPAAESGPDNPEWLISEDWALLQAVKQLLELPLNLTVVSPAHTPNWDLVSDVVNSCSRIYRSSKQCRNRYENVLIPREEGKSKNNRPLRTGQMYAQDENATHTQLYTSHFDLMKMTAGKRSPPIKPLLGMNPFQKNPKHASVLAESGINYDKPLPPIQVASLRAERIAKEKKALADQQKAQQPPVAQPPPPPPPPQPQPPPPQQPPPPLPQPPSAGSQQPAGPPAVQPQAQAQPPAQPTPPPPKAPPAITTVGSAAVLAGAIKTSVTGTSMPAGTVSGNVIVNTIAGVPAATFQSINKRLASPVAPGALTTSGGSAPAQVVHTQPRAVGSPATATSDMVSLAPTQGVRAVTSVTASAVVTTSLTPVQTPTRSLVTQVSQATGVQLPGKTITPAHFQLLRQQQQQQQASQVQVPQIQGQAQAPAQIKAVGKLTPEHLIKMQKQKLQLPQQAPPAQAPPGPPQPTAQVQVQPPQPTQQQSPQLTTVTAPRPGALLTGTTVANLQVARLTRVPTSQLQAQGQMQAPAPQPAQVALAKPPVVSVPAAVVSSPGVTTLPMNVAGISVAIGQPQKAAGQTVVAQPVHVQQLLKLKQQAVQQQKAIQPQAAPGPAAVQQKITAQQIAAQGQPQKVTYATQPALKTQFLTTPISQAQKLAGTQQVQTQIQVAKLPQVVQQQTPVASIQQVASASQQASPQTVTLTQATAAGQQVQVIPAVTATAQVVQQKLMQQQVVTTAAAQLQTPGVPNPAQVPASSDSPNQQPKLQMRVPAVRLKTPTKPPCP